MTEIYYSYGLISAGGGYAFKRNADGTYDAKDTGVNNAGAVKGVETLMTLIKDGVAAEDRRATPRPRPASTRPHRDDASTGPWAWNNLKKSKINFGVAPYPEDRRQAGRLRSSACSAR